MGRYGEIWGDMGRSHLNQFEAPAAQCFDSSAAFLFHGAVHFPGARRTVRRLPDSRRRRRAAAGGSAGCDRRLFTAVRV